MIAQTHNFLLPTILLLGTIILVFGMKYLSAARHTRLRLGGDDAFRLMAEKTAAAQSAGAPALAGAVSQGAIDLFRATPESLGA